MPTRHPLPTDLPRRGADAPPDSPTGALLDLSERQALPTFAELHDRWCAESRTRLGLSRQQWHHPATSRLVTALARGADLTAPLADLGEARAGAGLSLDETLSDLGVLGHLVPDPAAGDPDVGILRVDTLRAASVAGTAWAEAFYGELDTPGCTDPVTGLATGAYLEARLEQLYRQAAHRRRGPEETHVLVVLELRSAGTSPFGAIARRIRAASELRSTLAASDTIAILEPTHALVALVEGGPGLASHVAALETGATRDRVWVERLPATVDGALGLVRELATIPRLAVVAPDGDVGHP